MKLRFGFFRYLPLVLMLLTDNFVVEYFDPEPYSELYGPVYNGLIGMGCVLTLLYWRSLDGLMLKWLLLHGLVIGLLMLESYAGWGTWFVYPHVFRKIIDFTILFGVYGFYQRHGVPSLGPLFAVLLGALLVSFVANHPSSLSVGAFLAHERGYLVMSAYLFLLPALYFLAHYLAKGGPLRMSAALVSLVMIVFLQHRTVWLSTIAALAVLALLYSRIEGVKIRRLTTFVLVPGVVAMLGGVAVVLHDPQVLAKLGENVNDITNVEKQGTGGWRLRQFESYQPFIEAHPVAGMRLEGFELPIQFYSPDSDEPVWRDHTGHHFHSFYVDRLFYFGILGLLLALVVPIVLVVRRLRNATPFSPTVAAMLAFTISGLQYGFSFTWPPYFYGFIGLTLALAAQSVARVAPAVRQRPVVSPASQPLVYG